MRVRPLLAGAVVLALTFSLAACGDDGDDDTTDTADTDTEAEAEASEDTASEDTTADTEAETEDTTAETDDTAAEEGAGGDLTGLLVTVEDLGGGFVEEPYQTSPEPTPCDVDIDADNPYDTIVGAALVDRELLLALQHELRTYADAATAEAAFLAAQDGLSCGAETNRPGLVLGEVTDVTADIGADAFLVSVTVEEQGVEGGFVAVLVGPVLSVFQFQGPTEVAEGPDPLAVVTANTEALQAEVG